MERSFRKKRRITTVSALSEILAEVDSSTSMQFHAAKRVDETEVHMQKSTKSITGSTLKAEMERLLFSVEPLQHCVMVSLSIPRTKMAPMSAHGARPRNTIRVKKPPGRQSPGMKNVS